MNTYRNTWKKYLPLIKLLLKRSALDTQFVKLDSMDFNKSVRKNKISHSFKVELARGRMVTINASAEAKDLFDILSEDDVARTFIRENKYEISLGSDFELRITNQSLAPSDENAKISKEKDEKIS